MFIRKPLVLFRENVELYEELLWISDMNVVWGPLLHTHGRFYAKRVVQTEDAMSSWTHDPAHEQACIDAIRLYRKRKGLTKPKSVWEARDRAKIVKEQLKRPEFWNECRPDTAAH
jgi:hypothetical protein